MNPFQIVSREGGIVANNIFLSVILAIVLIGTLYPLAAEAMGDKISVGPPYFNKATAPIALLLMLALLLGPILRWRRDEIGRYKYWLVGFFAIILWTGVAAFGDLRRRIGVLPLLGLALSFALAVAAWLPLKGRKLLRTPLPVYGMVIAHFGLAVSVFGMASESGFSKETLTALAPGESAKVAGWQVKLDDVNPVVGDNWVAIEGDMIATRGGKSVTLHPQSRQFFEPVMQTSEAALLTRWDGQLYAVIAQPDGAWRWPLAGAPVVEALCDLHLVRRDAGRVRRAHRVARPHVPPGQEACKEQVGRRMKRSWLLWIPLAVVAFIGGLAIYGLVVPKDNTVYSAMVGEKLPEFALPPAMVGVEGLSNANMADGKPRLLNIFASWCIPCKVEAPHLEALKQAGAEIDAIAVRDRPQDVAAFLAEYGNPFRRIGSDSEMAVQLKLGFVGCAGNLCD